MIPLALALACSLAQQNCPSGQICVGAFDPGRRDCAGDAGTCAPLPTAPSIELSLPVPEGERVYCGKGNLHAESTHNACNLWSRFAFDLISPAFEPPHLVLASADGVAYFASGCATSDLNSMPKQSDCNGGPGNWVRIQHSPTVFSQYAHLSAILIHRGQTVKRGQPIGIEGNTGEAGAKHIHWSLHEGDARVGGPSVPMAKVRVRGRVLSGAELNCGDWVHIRKPDAKTAYISENRKLAQPEQYFFWPSPESLRGAAESSDPKTQQLAVEALGEYGDDLDARYWLGAVLQAAGRYDESRRAFEVVLAAPHGGRGLQAWSRLRLGEIALAEHKPDDARRLIDAAVAAKSDDGELVVRARRDLEALR